MKLVKLIAAVLLSLSVQEVLAGQVKGSLLYVGAYPGTIDDKSDYLAFSLDPTAADFFDWGLDENTPGSGYAAECSVTYAGWPVLVPMTATNLDVAKQAMALLASANATGQKVIMAYHHDDTTGICELDGVTVLAVGLNP